MTVADVLLETALIPGEPDLYVLGCWERNVSIYLQQVRALNLVYALEATGRLMPGRRVAVVGGGFAGLTAATALARRGCTVRVLERLPRLLHWQVGNRTRWIHPHLHEWPRSGSLCPDAGLPLLNWSADLAGRVAEKILAEFEGSVNVDVVCNVADVNLERQASSWRVQQEDYNAVILALGLGIEKSFGALPLNSYWTDDTVGTVQEGPVRRYLVSGVGEGGLIDTLYLRLRDFRHDHVVRDCLSVPGMEAVEEALLDIETGGENVDPRASSALLAERYARLDVPQAVGESLRSRLRTDTHVTLNGGGPSFLSNKADILNRFLMHRLIRMGDVPYIQGKLDAIEADGDGYIVRLDSQAEFRFDRVLIRHGTVPTMKQHFSGLWEKYVAARQGKKFQQPRPAWPEGFY